MILIFNLAFLWCLLISLLISLLILLLILLLIWRVMIPCCRCIFAANWLSSFKPTPIAFSLPKGIAGLPAPLAKGIGFDKRPSGLDKRPSGFDKRPSGFDKRPSGFDKKLWQQRVGQDTPQSHWWIPWHSCKFCNAMTASLGTLGHTTQQAETKVCHQKGSCIATLCFVIWLSSAAVLRFTPSL